MDRRSTRHRATPEAQDVAPQSLSPWTAKRAPCAPNAVSKHSDRTQQQNSEDTHTRAYDGRARAAAARVRPTPRGRCAPLHYKYTIRIFTVKRTGAKRAKGRPKTPKTDTYSISRLEHYPRDRTPKGPRMRGHGPR